MFSKLVESFFFIVIIAEISILAVQKILIADFIIDDLLYFSLWEARYIVREVMFEFKPSCFTVKQVQSEALPGDAPETSFPVFQKTIIPVCAKRVA
ncbi:unknown [Bacteroides sp. CAG:1076]|nr:unknown [Bacteroides sp. CAG:1076]